MSLLQGQLRFLNENGFEVLAVANGEDALREVQRTEGVRTQHIAMHREISLRADLRSLFDLVRLFRREKPDIVHANTPKGSLLAMMAAWLCRVPVRIYTVTGLRFETATGNFRRLLITMERIACWCATTVIPEGEGVKKTLIRERVTSKPLEVVLNGNINGIDLTHFNPDAVQPASPSPDFTFIFVGRIVRDKGIAELVSAFTKLHTSHPNTRLILLGAFEPELDPLPNDTVHAIQSHPAIVTPGSVNDVRPWLKSADVLVHPSYREGFPNVVLEGTAMGLPCVVTDINGSNEIIVDGKNGIIVPKQDANALANAMTRLCENAAMRNTIAAAARPMTADRYNRPDVHRAILARYRALTANLK